MSLSTLKRLMVQMPHHERLQKAYDMGVDYARNGTTSENCHYSLFATPELTKQWESGRNDEQARRKE